MVHLPPEVKQGIKEGIRFLCQDPHAGEPLKRELEGKRKLRMGRYRIIYQIQPAHHVVLIVAVGHRKSIYNPIQ